MVRLPKKQALTFLGNNSLSRLAHNAKDAPDLPRLVPNGRVGDVEKHVSRIAVPLDVERAILGKYSLAGLANASQQRLKIAPQLRPILPCRPTKCSWMLVTDRRRVGAVVQRDEFWTPEQYDLCLGG